MDNDPVTDPEQTELLPKPKKRKSPERFGPVTLIDLERLQEQAKEVLGGLDRFPELDELERQMDRLVLRARIAQADAKRERKKKAAE